MPDISMGAPGGLSAEHSCPIDHKHLGRYTMGNRALEIEVLQLFAGQAPDTLSLLAEAQSARDWHIAAHTLKGSARAVGAWELGTLAEAAERDGPAEPRRSEHLRRLAASLAVVRDYIDGLTVAA